MEIYKLFQRFHIFLVCVGFSISNIHLTGAQSALRINIEETPLDSSIIHGRLGNGLQYFIKNVDEADPKLHLRLYSKTGTNQEDKDQIDISHAVEHLAFKSTENFKDGIKFSSLLSKFHMSISDITAYNGSKLTQYHFTAPTSEMEALKIGFLWFKDIVGGLKFLEKDINQVGGELRQEFIVRAENYNHHFATMRMYSKIFPCANGYKSFDEFENKIKSEPLRNFHRDWYRPDLLAISLVGNIKDQNQMEEIIKETFSDFPPPENPRELTNCENNYFSSPQQFAVVERPMDSTLIKNDNMVDMHLYYRDRISHENLNNKIGLQRLIERQILRSIINQRFRAISNYYNAPLIYADDPFGKSGFPPTLEIVLSTDYTEEQQGIKKVMLILRQLELNGVSESEWKEEKEKQLQYIRNSNPKHAKYWTNEIREYFSTGEALPENKKQYLSNWLKNYSINEFDTYVNNFLSHGPDDIGIIAPKGNKALNYTEGEVRSWLNHEDSGVVKPYKVTEAPISLMDPDEIVALKHVEVRDFGTGDSGAREFVLENGINLVLINSNQARKNGRGEIRIQGFSEKGANCFPSEDFHSIINAPSIMSNSGVGRLDKFEINSYLADRNMESTYVSTYIDSNESGIQANATKDNLEDVLQLIYLHFTEPNKSKEAFQDWQSSKYKSLPDLRDHFKSTVERLSGNQSVMNNVMGIKSLRSGVSEESIEKTKLKVAYQRHKDLFSAAKDFTFIVNGDFEVDIVLPLLRKYLGNLSNKPTTCKSQRGNRNRIQEAYNVIEAPRPNKIDYTLYSLKFTKTAGSQENWEEQLKIKALGEITRQMTWPLRFVKDYSLYMLWVGGKKDLDRNLYEIGANFECVPEEYPLIRLEFKKIISQIKSGNIPEEMLRKGMNRLYSLYEKQRPSNNRVIHKNIYEHYRYNLPWVDPVKVENYLNSITIEDIVKTANKMYQEENLTEYMMKVN